MALVVPAAGHPDPFCINTTSQCAAGADIGVIGYNGSSGAWPVANTKGLFVPFTIIEPHTYTQMNWLNGATAAGSLEAGIYDSTGAMLRITAQTAQGTINTVQVAALSSTLTIGPGTYWLALATTLATSTFFKITGSTQSWRSRSCYQATITAGILPANVTYTAYTAAYVPLVGVSERAV